MTLINYFNDRPIHLVVLIANLIPIILIMANKDKSKPLLAFFCYCVVSFCVNLYTDILSSYRMNNIIYHNFWILISTLVVLIMFYYIFLDTFRKNLIGIISIAYTIIFFWDITYFNKDLFDLYNHKFVLYSLPLRSGIIILLCLMFYYELLKELYIEDLSKSHIFWIVCSLLIYNCVYLFSGIIFQTQYTWESNNFYRTIARLPLYFEIIMFIIISIGLIKSNKYVGE